MFCMEWAIAYLWISDYTRYSNSLDILWQKSLSWPEAFGFESEKSGGCDLREEYKSAPVLCEWEERSCFAV